MVGRQPEKQPDGRQRRPRHRQHRRPPTVMQRRQRDHTGKLALRDRHPLGALSGREPPSSSAGTIPHPGFGIFLSGMDLFIHQNFFTQIWHVA